MSTGRRADRDRELWTEGFAAGQASVGENEGVAIKQDAQTAVDALRLAVASRAIAPDERVWWVIEQILAFAPPSDGSDTAGARAFHEAVKDYFGTNREVTING